MTRKTQLFVWSMIAAMALVTVGLLIWRAGAFASLGGMTKEARANLTWTTFALVFLPALMALAAFGKTRMFARPKLPLADDVRRVSEISLIAATIFMACVYSWVAAAAVLGQPPGREFGGRVLEAATGVFFIVNANFAAKTSPPQGWPDPGRWIRATLRTGWVGVAAGLVILAGAIWAPPKLIVWIVLGATLAYVATAVLSHAGSGRKPA